jgi:hypothetical protein
MTALDDAIFLARDEPTLIDDFYRIFLDTALFVPTYEAAEGDKPIQPIVIPDGGVDFIPVFDSLERLSEWAQQEVHYVQVPAHIFLEGLNPAVYLALNPSFEACKEFAPDEIQWLKTWTREPGPDAATKASPSFRLEAPKRIPHGMQGRLWDYFAEVTEIRAAYLAKCQYAQRPVGWILVIELNRKNQTLFEKIKKEVELAVQGVLGSQVTLDILERRGEEWDQAVTSTVQPFYQRSAHHLGR